MLNCYKHLHFDIISMVDMRCCYYRIGHGELLQFHLLRGGVCGRAVNTSNPDLEISG